MAVKLASKLRYKSILRPRIAYGKWWVPSVDSNNCRKKDFTPMKNVLAGVILALVAVIFFTVPASASCTQPANAIEAENCLPGTSSEQWYVSGAGDPTIQGFATDMSVNVGQTISFKISTTASTYHIEIYRMGYYQTNHGARLITSFT